MGVLNVRFIFRIVYSLLIHVDMKRDSRGFSFLFFVLVKQRKRRLQMVHIHINILCSQASHVPPRRQRFPF